VAICPVNLSFFLDTHTSDELFASIYIVCSHGYV
jgi:hypothetical protein